MTCHRFYAAAETEDRPIALVIVLQRTHNGVFFGHFQILSDVEFPMSNPYQSPDAEFGGPPPLDGYRIERVRGKVKLLAILMFVQAGLQLLMGGGLIAVAVIIPSFLEAGMNREFQRQLAAQDEDAEENEIDPGLEAIREMQMYMAIMYGSMGAAGFLPAPLLIWAGIRNLKLRGRTLGIVAVSANMISLGTCYCAPTAIGIFVFGLVVYLNEEVRQTFLASEQAAAGGQQFDMNPPSFS